MLLSDYSQKKVEEGGEPGNHHSPVTCMFG